MRRGERKRRGGDDHLVRSLTPLMSPVSCNQWQREAGVLDLHPGLRGDDVTGRRAGLSRDAATFFFYSNGNK